MAEFIDLILLTAWGIVLGLLFHLYRLVFARMEGRKVRYIISYVFWWSGMIGLTVFYLLLVNGGQLRLYGLLGMSLGIALYTQWLYPRYGPFFSRFLGRMAHGFALIGRGVRWVFTVILFPFALILMVLEKGIAFIFYPVRKIAEKRKKIALQQEQE